MQRIADAVGYSKTGLLHRYPVQGGAAGRGHRPRPGGDAGDHHRGRPAAARTRARPCRAHRRGPARAAPARAPYALLLTGLLGDPDSEIGHALDKIGDAIFAAFAVDLRGRAGPRAADHRRARRPRRRPDSPARRRAGQRGRRVHPPGRDQLRRVGTPPSRHLMTRGTAHGNAAVPPRAGCRPAPHRGPRGLAARARRGRPSAPPRCPARPSAPSRSPARSRRPRST